MILFMHIFMQLNRIYAMNLEDKKGLLKIVIKKGTSKDDDPAIYKPIIDKQIIDKPAIDSPIIDSPVETITKTIYKTIIKNDNPNNMNDNKTKENPSNMNNYKKYVLISDDNKTNEGSLPSISDPILDPVLSPVSSNTPISISDPILDQILDQILSSNTNNHCYIITSPLKISFLDNPNFINNSNFIKYKNNLFGFSFCSSNEIALKIIKMIKEKNSIINIEEDKVYRIDNDENPIDIERLFFQTNNLGNLFFNNYFFDNFIFRRIFNYNKNYNKNDENTGRGIKMSVIDKTVKCDQLKNSKNSSNTKEYHWINKNSILTNKTSFSANSLIKFLNGVDCNGKINLSHLLYLLDNIENENDILILKIYGPNSEILDDLLKRLSHKMIIVVTAGNNNEDGCNFSPNGKSIIKIGTVNKYGRVISNDGSCVDLYAIGENGGSVLYVSSVISSYLEYIRRGGSEGVMVDSSSNRGVMVDSSSNRGVMVDSSSNRGVMVDSSSNRGVMVDSSSNRGDNTTTPSITNKPRKHLKNQILKFLSFNSIKNENNQSILKIPSFNNNPKYKYYSFYQVLFYNLIIIMIVIILIIVIIRKIRQINADREYISLRPIRGR